MSSHANLLAITPSLRPNFLLLSAAMVVLSAGLLAALGHQMDVLTFVWVTVMAVLAHALVNLKNEIDDTRSGLDALTTKTPFSGGTGTLLQSEAHLQKAKALFYGVFLLFAGLGMGLLSTLSLSVVQMSILLLMVLLGVWIIWFYTTVCNRSVLLSSVVSGLSFGPIIMVATAMVVAPEQWGSLLLWSLLPFVWVNNLLLINQIPDQEADAQVGRRNFVIVYGYFNALKLYLITGWGAMLLLAVLLVSFAPSPWLWLLMVWVLVLLKIQQNIKMLILPDGLMRWPHTLTQTQGLTVVMNLGLPLSIGLAFLISAL